MLTCLDLMERATNGPFIFEDAYTLDRLIPNVRQVVRDFEIRYDPTLPVPTDVALAHRLFDAAVQLIVSNGIYCSATNRVIEVTRAEVLEAARHNARISTFGEGRERRSFELRRPDDPHPPWCHVGTGTVASTEAIALAQVEGYGSIPQADSISVPALNRVRGMLAMSGSPLEIHATAASLQVARRALARCGRPGLPILNLISSATASMATIAGSHPSFGLRPSDGWLINFIAEMKVNFETLNRLAFVQLIGGNVGSTAIPLLGGYAGGPAGTAVVMVAYHLLGALLFDGSYHLTGPLDVRLGCSTTRAALWVFAMAGRATSMFTRYPAIALGYAAAGPATRTYFWEAAAVNLACVPAGYAGLQTVHPAKAVVDDGVTPLKARFNVELAHAAARMSAEQANEVVNRLLTNYETELAQAPTGQRYQECYDPESQKPTEGYVRLYEGCKAELYHMGVPLEEF